MDKRTLENIDAYIADFPVETQKKLLEMRSIIHSNAPEASEAISYQMPTFKRKGNLVHFAGYKNHIGFYPGAATVAHFKNELGNYQNAKGSVQFPLDQPLPNELISRMVQFRVGLQKKK